MSALRIGSLFSGAGGLDLAVEAVFGGHVVWQSEIDVAGAAVLAHNYPSAKNLGDVTDVDWAAVEPVDILCGGFPCQDVSTAASYRRAGMRDGNRSGLWARMADAIATLQTATHRHRKRQRTYSVQQPIATWNEETQTWETYGQRAPFSATWPTSGMTRSGQLLPLTLSAPRTDVSASLSWLTEAGRTRRKSNRSNVRNWAGNP